MWRPRACFEIRFAVVSFISSAQRPHVRAFTAAQIAVLLALLLWSAAPLMATPLLYNYIFLTGLMNYIFGIGLALWALACWISLRQRHWTLRLTTSILFVIALFFCHLSALGIYGVGLLATEIFW